MGEPNIDDKTASNTPTFLRTLALVVPIVAGLGTVATQYFSLQRDLEKERTAQVQQQTQQAATRAELEKALERERTAQAQAGRDAEKARHDTAKEETARLQLQADVERARGDVETGLQRLRTEEQAARRGSLDAELQQRQQELELKSGVERLVREGQEDLEVTNAVTEMLKADPDMSLRGMAVLTRYIATPRHREVIVAGIAAKFRRLKAVEEAEMLGRLLERLVPLDTELLQQGIRVAQGRLPSQSDAVGAFWRRYSARFKETPPLSYLEREESEGEFKSRPEIVVVLRADIQKWFPQPPGDPDDVEKRLPEILEATRAQFEGQDNRSFEAYNVLRERCEQLLGARVLAVATSANGASGRWYRRRILLPIARRQSTPEAGPPHPRGLSA